MILVDANILIYAATVCPRQTIARSWLNARLSGVGRVGLPWQSLTAFLRVVTNQRIYGVGAATLDAAWAQVEAWLASPNAWVPTPRETHPTALKLALKSAGSGGNHVTDAHLAAIAIEHGLTLCTADRGFARFKDLKWINPLDE